MVSRTPSSMAVKVYFDIKDDQVGLYRSIRVLETTTFGELHARVSEKIGISTARSVFFRLALRYDSAVAHLKCDYTPAAHQLVTSTVEQHETTWAGEVLLVYVDIRVPSKRLVETSSANAEIQRQANLNLRAVGPSPMTEFYHHWESADRFTAITEAILTEVENVCIKKGKLLKMHKGRDSLYREVVVFLDQTRLWFSKGAEGDHMLAFIELSLDDTFKILDENSHTFAVRSTIGSSAIFRAKSRTDMALWRTALEGRSETVSENNLIAMADDHICQQELDRVEDNFRSLSSLSEFRGTLCNRYLRMRFRNYLVNSDEDHLLRFWEYAEDFKLCHAVTHRFDEQHDLTGRGSTGRAWPDNYRCSSVESKKFATFIYNTFLVEGGAHTLRLADIPVGELDTVREQLPRAPRTLFVSLQRIVMRDLMHLFYKDFAHPQQPYRSHFISASMDLFGCYETESAECGPLSPAAALLGQSPGSARECSPQLNTPDKAIRTGRGRRNSFSVPFDLIRSLSNSAVTTPQALRTDISLRKAVSLDNPGNGGSCVGRISPTGTPQVMRPLGGIAFGTPTRDPPGSPMSFVFTPSPPANNGTQAAASRAVIAPETPAGNNTSEPNKKGWFSGLRIFRKDPTSEAEQRFKSGTEGATKRDTPIAAAPSTPAHSGYSRFHDNAIALSTPGANEDIDAPYEHPWWRIQSVRVPPRDSVIWLSDAWWRGKAPAMERYLETVSNGDSDGLQLYNSYAQWAPGKHLDDVLTSVRNVVVSESMLHTAAGTSPLASPAHSFSYAPTDAAGVEYSMSPMRDSFEESLRAQLEEERAPVPSIHMPKEETRNRNVIVWKGGHVKHHKTHHTHHTPYLYKKRSDSNVTSPQREVSSLQKDTSPRPEKTEFVVTADSVARIENAGTDVGVEAAMPLQSSAATKMPSTLHQHLHIPIGMYDARVVRDANNLSTVGTALSKPFSCTPYSLVFDPEYKLTVHGIPILWSSSGMDSRGGRSNRSASLTANKNFSSPSPSFNDRASLSGSGSRSKGSTNIFMNRKMEAYARLGEVSRQNELEAGRLKGVAAGLQVGSAFPLPPYLGGFRGQILMWSHVKARYIKHVAHGTHSSSSASVVSGSSASQATSKASQSTQKVGASPRHLNSSRGLADLTIGSATFPPPPESDSNAWQQPKVLQDKEIDHSDMTRYCALLLLRPDGHCSILLFSFNSGNGSIASYGLEEPQLRAIIDLHKATLVSPSSLNAFNIYDETGLIWTVYPEGIDEDDARGGSKRWLDVIKDHVPSGQKGPKVVCIVYEGYLAKRGLLNTAFRRRWFIMNSKRQLRYFKEESGQCKGEISIAQVLNIEVNGREMSLHTKNRLWVLQADSEEEVRLWMAAIQSMMLISGTSEHALQATVEADGADPEYQGESFMDDD